MNTGDRFDQVARDLHAHALDALSPRTRAQLQVRRRETSAAPRLRGFAWPLATACAIAALALGWQLQRPQAPAPASTPLAAAAGESDSTTLALDENPDFYAWLASSDADTLAME